MATNPYASLILDPLGLNTRTTVGWARIMQTERQHDMAVVTVRGANAENPEYATGTPCHIVYGWNPGQLEHFYGYVNHVTPSYERNESINPNMVYMDVVCVGASWVLKQPYSAIYPNTRASVLVQQIATNVMFSATVQGDDFIWPQLSNPGVSAWSFLVDLAERLGWMLACNRTNIRFLSIEKIMAQQSASIRTFHTRLAAPNPVFETISDFEVLQGETMQMDGHVRAKRVLANVELDTGTVFTVTNNEKNIDSSALGKTSVAPFFTRYETGLMASDQQHGQNRLNAEAQRNRFHIQAKATVSGDTTVTQGIPIVLSGLGKTNSGIWYVEEVVHKFKVASYTMDLTLGRDASGDRSQPVGTPTTALQVTNRFAVQTANAPATVLSQSGWRATWQGQQVVGL